MTTERLYWNDPFAFSFEARVVAHATWKGSPALVLDRTAFYPESGGQMADRGTLGSLRVTDVQVDGSGRIHHVVEAEELPPAGSVVQGAIDAGRRRLHMAQHTGQHMLSRALLEVADAATVSSRLGESGCTIDVALPRLPEARLAAAEKLVNEVVEEDLRVRAWFPDERELAELELRSKAKPVEGPIRVVSVDGFDAQACGGTHCTRTAQVGMVRILGTEANRGGLRISFAAGRRAREGLLGEASVLRSLARELTSGPDDVPAAVAKLRRDLDELRARSQHATERLAEELAARLAVEGDALPVVAVLDDPPEVVRMVASRLCARPGAVAVLGARGPEGVQVVACRGEGTDFDCGAFVRRLAERTGGRGGGRPERAEGRFPPDLDAPTLREVVEAG